MPRRAVAIVGPGECSAGEAQLAYEVGKLVAERGLAVVTGGLGGVMASASQGAHDAGGLVVGILPGRQEADANRWVDLAIPTGMGELRNGLVVRAASAVIAIGGEYGTLSEIGLALKMGIPVVGLDTWELAKHGKPRDAIVSAGSPVEAVERALELME